MKLQLIDGSSIELRFDTYFLHRVSRLAGKVLHELPLYLIGDAVINDDGVVESGTYGPFADLECRAVILAAATDSYNQFTGNSTQQTIVDGFTMMNNIPSTLTNGVWGTIYAELLKAIIPEADEPQKKSGAKKANSSAGGNSKRSASEK